MLVVFFPISSFACSLDQQFEIDQGQHFTYGVGPQGSMRLRNAVSQYFNYYFHPLVPTQPDEFLAVSGVSAMVDHLTRCLCDEGDGILFPQPLYTGFSNDVPTRARGKLLPASFARDDGSIHLDDVFDAEANTRCLERAYQRAICSGMKVRAVMITNPHNPLGKCYPVETIKAIASFCAKHDLHYLSDEIYAMTVFGMSRVRRPHRLRQYWRWTLATLSDLSWSMCCTLRRRTSVPMASGWECSGVKMLHCERR